MQTIGRCAPMTVVCDTRDFGIGPAGHQRHKPKLGLTVNFTLAKPLDVTEPQLGSRTGLVRDLSAVRRTAPAGEGFAPLNL
jgi:hypothetical protein